MPLGLGSPSAYRLLSHKKKTKEHGGAEKRTRGLGRRMAGRGGLRLYSALACKGMYLSPGV